MINNINSMNMPMNMNMIYMNQMNNNMINQNNPKEKLSKLILNLNSKMMEVNKIIYQINSAFNQLYGTMNNDFLNKMKKLLQNFNSFNNNFIPNNNIYDKIKKEKKEPLLNLFPLKKIINVLFKVRGSKEHLLTVNPEYGVPLKDVIKRFEQLIEKDKHPQYIVNSNRLKYYTINISELDKNSNEKIKENSLDSIGPYKTILVGSE